MARNQSDPFDIKTQEFIIQPTSFCNINCRYCYLPNRLSTKRMDTRTLSCIFDRIFSSSLISDSVKILWHAGEPMTLPIRFYDEAFQLIEQHNTHQIPVIFAFQTNGTRITQQWCDFINNHQVNIGISLDGPKYIHDANRVDRAGKGTFERIIEDILSNHKFIDLNTEVQMGVARCKSTCDYFIFCGGGSPANKLSENGTFNSTETTLCKLKIKATTDVVLAHLENCYQKEGV